MNFEYLYQLLKTAIIRLDLPKGVGVFFSGGIDSSILAKMLVDLNYSPTLFSIGNHLSKDKPFIDDFKTHFKCKNYFINVTKPYIQGLIGPVYKILREKTPKAVFNYAETHRRHYENLSTYPIPMDVSIAIGLYVMATHKYAPKIFVSGQGGDDIFGGYSRFLKLPLSSLQNELEKTFESLCNIDIVRDTVIIESVNKKIHFPYLDTDFVAYSLYEIPAELKIVEGKGKYIWYKFGEFIGLPASITTRRKNAMQYSTGLSRWIKF